MTTLLRDVIAIRLTAPGTRPEHITDFKFTDPEGTWQCTRSQMVAFVTAHQSGAAYTLVDGTKANLHVVGHWVETMPDYTKKDNLLNLPRF
jgi:hypothetical protein